MTEFVVYFEIFGKKMKSKVFAKDKNEAEQKIKDKIIFHKTAKANESIDNIFKNIMDILK